MEPFLTRIGDVTIERVLPRSKEPPRPPDIPPSDPAAFPEDSGDTQVQVKGPSVADSPHSHHSDSHHSDSQHSIEGHHSDALLNNEDHQSDAILHNEDHHSDAILNNEDHHSNAILNNEDHHSNAILHNENQHSDAILHNEDHHSDSILHNEDHHSHAILHDENQHSDSILNNEGHHSNAILHNEDHHSDASQHSHHSENHNTISHHSIDSVHSDNSHHLDNQNKENPPSDSLQNDSPKAEINEDVEKMVEDLQDEVKSAEKDDNVEAKSASPCKEEEEREGGGEKEEKGEAESPKSDEENAGEDVEMKDEESGTKRECPAGGSGEERAKKRRKKSRDEGEEGAASSDSEGDSSGGKDKTSTERKLANMRRNIREVMNENELDEETKAAQRLEMERLRRVQEQQRIIREVQKQIMLQNKQKGRLMSLQSSSSLLRQCTITTTGGATSSSAAPAASAAPGNQVRIPSSVLMKLAAAGGGEANKKVMEMLTSHRKLPPRIPGHEQNLGTTAGARPCAGASVSLLPSRRPSLKEELLSDSDDEREDDDDDGVILSESEDFITVSPRKDVLHKPLLPTSASSLLATTAKPKGKDVVTISSSSSSEDDDCMILSGGSGDESEPEDPSNSGMHTNDLFNVPDENNQVLINVGHPKDEPDIFLAPQIARQIKPHQIGGLRFLYDNLVESLERVRTTPGFGCILAHSMGLGKTLQVVAFCDVFLRHTSARTVLCIMPINTLQNWVAEFNLWMPPEPLASQQATEQNQVRARDFPLHVLNDSHKSLGARTKVIREWHQNGGVLLIGYELYRQLSMRNMRGRKKGKRGMPDPVEPEEDTGRNKRCWDDIHNALVKPGPDLVICDEGHRIKNSHASISVALKSISSKRRVVLTGYPLQNNLLEYWCMVDFVRPNYLGTKTEFCNMFERPIQNGQCIDSTPQDIRLMRYRAHVLHSLLQGFVQRRSHSVLQVTLPQKNEYVLLLRMTAFQRQLYDKFMNEVVRTKAVPNPLKAFAVCCKIWNHPDVLYYWLKKHGPEEDVDLDLEEPAVPAATPGLPPTPGSSASTPGEAPKKVTPSKSPTKGRPRLGQGKKDKAPKPEASVTPTQPTKASEEASDKPEAAPPTQATPGQGGMYPGSFPPGAYQGQYFDQQQQQQQYPSDHQYPPQGYQEFYPGQQYPGGQAPYYQDQYPGSQSGGGYFPQQGAGYQANPYWQPSPGASYNQDGSQFMPSSSYPSSQNSSSSGYYGNNQYPNMMKNNSSEQQNFSSSRVTNDTSYPNNEFNSYNPYPNTTQQQNPNTTQQNPVNHPNTSQQNHPLEHANTTQQNPIATQQNPVELSNTSQQTPVPLSNTVEQAVSQLNIAAPIESSNPITVQQNLPEVQTPVTQEPPFSTPSDPITFDPIIPTETAPCPVEAKVEPESEVKEEKVKEEAAKVEEKEVEEEEGVKTEESREGKKPPPASAMQDIPPEGVRVPVRLEGKSMLEIGTNAYKAGREEPTIAYDWALDLLKGYEPGHLESCAKMEVLFCILEESMALGDRLLVFSQSLFTLNLIEDFLQRTTLPGTQEKWARNTNYYRLDGSTSALEREKLINEYNTNPKIHLFLVSTRAGSLGINLVGANRVVVFDASWNPCHDTQAVCRVYRYGQRKPCFVYRLVMDKCLEKKIYDRQINKQGMADRVVDELNPDAHLSIKEVSNLLYDSESDTEMQDFSGRKDKYIDVVMQKVLARLSHALSKEPFQHESLLVDRKEKKLSQAERRLAKRNYELEKQATLQPRYSNYSVGPAGAVATGAGPSAANHSASGLQIRPIRMDGAKPIASVRPMQAEQGSSGSPRGQVAPGAGGRSRWIPAEVWQRQGMSAQEMTLPLDVVIPTNSPDRASIVLKAGQRVMVLKSPKGIYMQLENGKIIAIRTALKMGESRKNVDITKSGNSILSSSIVSDKKVSNDKESATISKIAPKIGSVFPLKSNSEITITPRSATSTKSATHVTATITPNPKPFSATDHSLPGSSVWRNEQRVQPTAKTNPSRLSTAGNQSFSGPTKPFYHQQESARRSSATVAPEVKEPFEPSLEFSGTSPQVQNSNYQQKPQARSQSSSYQSQQQFPSKDFQQARNEDYNNPRSSSNYSQQYDNKQGYNNTELQTSTPNMQSLNSQSVNQQLQDSLSSTAMQQQQNQHHQRSQQHGGHTNSMQRSHAPSSIASQNTQHQSASVQSHPMTGQHSMQRSSQSQHHSSMSNPSSSALHNNPIMAHNNPSSVSQTPSHSMSHNPPTMLNIPQIHHSRTQHLNQAPPPQIQSLPSNASAMSSLIDHNKPSSAQIKASNKIDITSLLNSPSPIRNKSKSNKTKSTIKNQPSIDPYEFQDDPNQQHQKSQNKPVTNYYAQESSKSNDKTPSSNDYNNYQYNDYYGAQQYPLGYFPTQFPPAEKTSKKDEVERKKVHHESPKTPNEYPVATSYPASASYSSAPSTTTATQSASQPSFNTSGGGIVAASQSYSDPYQSQYAAGSSYRNANSAYPAYPPYNPQFPEANAAMYSAFHRPEPFAPGSGSDISSFLSHPFGLPSTSPHFPSATTQPAASPYYPQNVYPPTTPTYPRGSYPTPPVDPYHAAAAYSTGFNPFLVPSNPSGHYPLPTNPPTSNEGQ